MSVNGDLMVVRNGRSTSQVSVYNYPEHLNPFYEDDNHKRLRFWKINKSPKDGEGRRSSFSLGGLKDIWAFKSFRMKKKSSSLGINKTSESPPPLRRELYPNQNGYSTYDPRMRYTTGASNGFGGENNAFQRNVPYRSSLQDMRNAQNEQPINGFGFNRNDRYRSTIQTATTSSTPTQSLTLPQSRRYVYRGSVTPQPVRNNEFNSDSLGMISRGSSQVSVASTNPFDDEDDDDVVIGSISASSTPAKHPARKKRRAPPPPVPVHQIIKEESSSAGSTPTHKTSNNQEENGQTEKNESLEIHNLTAEIESFVKSSSSDSTENIQRSPASPKTQKQNGTIPKIHTSPVKEQNGEVISNIDIIITPYSEPLFIQEDQDMEVTTICKDSPTKKKQQKEVVNEVGHVEIIHVHVESPRSTPERSKPSGVSTFRSETRSQLSNTNANHSLPENILKNESVNEVLENSENSPTKTTVKVHNLTENINSPPKETVKIIQMTEKSPVKEKSSEELKIKESSEKPPIAVKPSLPKSPPLNVSPRMIGARRDFNYSIETPDTPAMKRREVKTETDIPSSPESNHREIGIDVEQNTPSEINHREVSKTTYCTVTTAANSPIVHKSSKHTPVPAVREQNCIQVERTSPLPATRKVVTTNDSNLSNSQESKTPILNKGIEIEEKILNTEVDLPTTISELQLKILELEESTTQEIADEPSTSGTTTSNEISPQHEEASTSNIETAHPAPIKKPPRTKHNFAEEALENLYRPKPNEWKQSTLAPLAPVPPEKRRSVKQIIESINRSQRLLGGVKKEDETEIDAMNQQRTMSETNTNAMEQNLKSLAESQREMKRMLQELESLENTHREKKLSNKSDENFQGILDTIVNTLAKETNKNNGNTEVFKKCTITKEVNNTSRESSPTSSNLDWNPVPKPKRTKNLSPELQVKRNNRSNE